jgi:phenylalanyl-tRNA synthetase beta chain
MKVSLDWLRELVDIRVPTKDFAHALTMGGLEVEEIAPVAPEFSGIVVGHVKSVSPHPNADKLRVTEVDAGTGEILQIVCGAPNVAAGQKVPCALVGAKLPAMEIKKAKLRGVESSGMLCSARELGMSDDHAGLLVLDADAPIGRDVREVLGLGDTYLTLKLTPNRGDCLSMFGIARDAGAILKSAVNLPAAKEVAATIGDARAIRISAPKACGVYYGRVIKGIDPSRSTPEWMVRRLERAGLRGISPLVDITNYVMLERGQPMHAFDHGKLRGGIDVRFMNPGERIKLLNGDEVEYRQDLLAITDESGPVALGGAMGGHDTMVNAATTDVFFEAAFFHPETVQGRARELALTSDAAYRYERGVDYGATRAAMERATALVLEICGGAAGPIVEARGELPTRSPTLVRPARVRTLLGYPLDETQMPGILKRLSCGIAEAPMGMQVTPPSWRFDLVIEEDFVEEIARIHGYEHVPSVAPRSSLPMLPVKAGTRDRFDLRHALADLGYQEIVSYSFVSEDWERDFAANANPVRLANPIASHMSAMRTTLVGGLVQALRSNLNRGEERVRVFEIGRCFEGAEPDIRVQPERIAGLSYGGRWDEQWGQPSQPVDFFDAKGDVEALAGTRRFEYAAAAHPACHPGRCARILFAGHPVGVVGELHPRLQQKYELPSAPVLFEIDTGPLLEGAAPRFKGVSRMPAVRRDQAMVFDESVPANAVLAAIRGVVPPFVREVEVFDMYRGKGIDPGKKSLALRIVMQDTDRTLTDSEVESVMASIREQLQQQFGARPRT